MYKSKNLSLYIAALLASVPVASHAAFVESTLGNAVTNDASASFYNPAALVLLPNNQILLSDTYVSVLSKFKGTATQGLTGYTQTGTATSRTHYYLPDFYVGYRATDKLVFGFGVLYNFYGESEYPADSIVRYVQTTNKVSSLDFVPAVGYRVNDVLSVGAGLDVSYTKLTLNAMVGFPSFGIPDVASVNESSAMGYGAHAGILLQPALGTTIGLAVHTPVTVKSSGKSSYHSEPEVISKDYRVKVTTPARAVFTISQYVSREWGFIGTIQRMQWSTIDALDLQNVALQFNGQPVTSYQFNSPYYLRNTWRATVGSHYLVTPKWMVRGSVSYDQDPTNPKYQIAAGDSIVVGGSTGYEFNKNVIVDVSYAHIFTLKKNIHIMGNNIVNGNTTGNRDAVSIQLTYNLI